MTRKSKDIISIVDGVKITMCSYRGPRKGESTFDINKSRYTPWAQTVSKYVRGSAGCLGTVEKVLGFGVQ
jgi:hypothetical protein